MKFFIKPKTIREVEVWDSGWRCGLFAGTLLGIIALIIVTLIIK